jgi:hypothetical protein
MTNTDLVLNVINEDTRELLVELERLPLARELKDRIQTLRADVDEALEATRSRRWGT